jgi:hypothetical protein
VSQEAPDITPDHPTTPQQIDEKHQPLLCTHIIIPFWG